MKHPRTRRVVVAGGSPAKMGSALAVLTSHGFDATGVFSEREAHQAISRADEIFAVVAGGFLAEPAQNRLRAAAASRGAILITANIGHQDPTEYFSTHIVPQLVAADDRPCAQATAIP
ncbi:hypothetical protein [Nocardia terpenica]|uniref:Uncharacterized protein n=1 Tax=Nocardia terpenica TaxID=455432 RepID=A0A164KRY7_9NOCA|nr:hypothetical protein [Nocardia terpenica]KZM71665.1 hypothetical protein AWN90_02800 [Nocardia terpenica]NQE90894.1 hypothetical protein [Nocardia terpenica]